MNNEFFYKQITTNGSSKVSGIKNSFAIEPVQAPTQIGSGLISQGLRSSSGTGILA
jgi:hypothetical protein